VIYIQLRSSASLTTDVERLRTRQRVQRTCQSRVVTSPFLIPEKAITECGHKNVKKKQVL